MLVAGPGWQSSRLMMFAFWHLHGFTDVSRCQHDQGNYFYNFTIYSVSQFLNVTSSYWATLSWLSQYYKLQSGWCQHWYMCIAAKEFFFLWLKPSLLAVLKVSMVSQKPIQEINDWHDDQLPIIHPWIIDWGWHSWLMVWLLQITVHLKYFNRWFPSLEFKSW